MKAFILDERKSKITWKGKNNKMTNKGEMKFANGKLFTELGEVVEGFVGIDFDSLTISDDVSLNDDQKKELITHLKSKDFLDTKNFPVVEYKIDNIVTEAGKTKLKGNLNFKQEAYGLNFPVEMNVSDKRVTADANFKLQGVNPLLKDRINNNNGGGNNNGSGPINEIEIDFHVVAELQQL